MLKLRRPPANAVAAALLSFLTFVVAASAAPTGKWFEARSPNFIVVSNAGEGQARKIAVQFEQLRSLFRDSLPYVKNESYSPVITILAVKDSLKELLPEYWAEKGRTHPAGIFVARGDQRQIAVNLSAHGDNNALEGVYHEYYHSVTMPYFPGLPTWVSEGLAEFYGNSIVHDKTADLGMANPTVIEELRSQPFIPLPLLLKADHNSPYYNEQNKASMFYAESWALAHYLMLGDKRSHEAAFGAYLNALSQGATQDQAASNAFGDLGKLQSDLRAYISGMLFPAIEVPSSAKMPESDLMTRPLSEAEVAAYSGGFLSVHNQFSQAEPLLNQSAQLDPKLGLAQRNLALLHYYRNEREQALTCLSSAIALDPRDSSARYLRAQLTFEARGPSGSDSQIEDDLRQSLASDPNFAPANGLLALYLGNVNERLPEALSFAQKANALEPGNITYQVALGQVLARMHRFDEAQVLGQRILAGAADDNGRLQAKQLLNYISQSRDYDNRVRAMQEASAARAAANAPPADSVQATTNAEPGSSGDADSPVLKRRDAGADGLSGVVTLVRCTGDEMEVTVKANSQPAPVVFHTKDRNKVTYASNVSAIRGDIEPCNELKGHLVVAGFHAPLAKPYYGELDSLTVVK